MTKVLLTGLAITIVSACSSGVSEEQLNQLMEQNKQLMEQNQQQGSQYNDSGNQEFKSFMVIRKSRWTLHQCQEQAKNYLCGSIAYNISETDKIYVNVSIHSDCWQKSVIGELLPISCKK